MRGCRYVLVSSCNDILILYGRREIKVEECGGGYQKKYSRGEAFLKDNTAKNRWDKI